MIYLPLKRLGYTRTMSFLIAIRNLKQKNESCSKIKFYNVVCTVRTYLPKIMIPTNSLISSYTKNGIQKKNNKILIHYACNCERFSKRM